MNCFEAYRADKIDSGELYRELEERKRLAAKMVAEKNSKCFICGKKREMFRTEKVEKTIREIVKPGLLGFDSYTYENHIEYIQVPLCRACDTKLSSWFAGGAEKSKLQTFPGIVEAKQRVAEMKCEEIGPDKSVKASIWRGCSSALALVLLGVVLVIICAIFGVVIKR